MIRVADPLPQDDGPDESRGRFADTAELQNERWYDPTGEAHFGRRRLDGMPWVPGVSSNPIGDFFGLNLCHEQLFFDDGQDPPNLGKFKDGIHPDDPMPDGYRMNPTQYDDNLMRQAVNNIPPSQYNFGLCNCQDWAKDVREEYDRLKNHQPPPQMPSWPFHGGYGRGGW